MMPCSREIISGGYHNLQANCQNRDGSYEKSVLWISPKAQAYNDDGVLRCVPGTPKELCFEPK